MPAMLKSDLPFPCRRGKVRDVYDLGDALLIVATDRISAFDVVMPDGIPDKGKILTALSLFWFDRFGDEHHLIDSNIEKYPAMLQPFAHQLRGRSMLVKKASVVPFECVARGYLAGSGWKEYQATGQVCGAALPPGLQKCEKLPQPIFSPATKAESGHDENVSFDMMAEQLGSALATDLRDRTLRLYSSAAKYAFKHGVIIADTKFEFGIVDNNRVILIDEMLTPDSSRFWPVDAYAPGRDQPSFDKQFLRNWLELQPWNKTAPAPPLPPQIVQGTRDRYALAYQLLVGKPFTG